MKYLVALVALLLPLAGFAVDGDRIVSGDGVAFVKKSIAYWLCEDKVAASSTCGPMTVQVNSRGGAVFEIVRHTACSGNPTVVISEQSDSTGVEHEIVTLTLNGVSAFHLGPGHQPLSVLSADLSNMTACTDFDVAVHYIEAN